MGNRPPGTVTRKDPQIAGVFPEGLLAKGVHNPDSSRGGPAAQPGRTLNSNFPETSVLLPSGQEIEAGLENRHPPVPEPKRG